MAAMKFDSFLGLVLVALAGTLTPHSTKAQALLYQLTSPNEQEFGRFGVSVSGVPDVDGDGRGDVVVGAYGEGDFAV
jgi:hypothetical protein